MKRSRWVLACATLALVVAGCSDDDGGDRAAGTTKLSTAPSTTPTTQPPTTFRGEPSEACDVVTRADAEVLFGEAARTGAPGFPGPDSVCVWYAGDEDEGPYQFLEFRIHQGSSLESRTTSTAGGIVLTSQWGGNGVVFALSYRGTGPVGETSAKQDALAKLAELIADRTGFQ